jgi:hypothetical protein
LDRDYAGCRISFISNAASAISSALNLAAHVNTVPINIALQLSAGDSMSFMAVRNLGVIFKL